MSNPARANVDWVVNSLIQEDNFRAKVNRIEELLSIYAVDEASKFSGKPAVGVDLDRTMVYTNSSIGIDTISGYEALRVAELYKGKPFSYTTSVAYSMLEILNGMSYLIPVTTRTTEQYRRIRIPGTTDINLSEHTDPQYAITANGGNILVDGVPDEDWAEHVKVKISESCASLEEISSLLSVHDADSWLIERRIAENLFTYLFLDRAETPPELIDEMTHEANKRNWTVSLQGRKLYFVPMFMTKGYAFEEICRRLNVGYSMTAGDSLLDIPLLEAGDIAIRPNHGELETVKYTADNLTVTDNHGIFAGEEIVARMLAHAYASK